MSTLAAAMPQTTTSATSASSTTSSEGEAIVPLYKFSDSAEFCRRHEAAVRAEYALEAEAITAFNQREDTHKAWILQKLPYSEYIIYADLRQMDGLMPQIGQSFSLAIDTGDASDRDWFLCNRREPTVKLGVAWKNFAEIFIKIPRGWTKPYRHLLTPLTNMKHIVPGTMFPETSKAIQIFIRLRASKATMQAELAASAILGSRGASANVLAAFDYMMTFQNPTRHVNIFEVFTHMKNLEKMSPLLCNAFKKELSRFDKDQLSAFQGLGSIAEGVAFVPGGPGAGKTTWTLTTTTMAQAGPTRVLVLYMIDLNKSADDAADRVQAKYNKLGLKKRVIRMRSWPTVKFEKKRDAPEMTSAMADLKMLSLKHGEFIIISPPKEEVIDCNDDDECKDGSSQRSSQIAMGDTQRALQNANFTPGFLAEYESKIKRDPNKAPTLDQVALELYNTDRGWYGNVELALERARNLTLTEKEHREATEQLRCALIHLYAEALESADFIVTTPVAAKRHLPEIFKPDIVILDEAGHARELTAMIALAFFEPKVWFFTGDHRQTSPYSAVRSNDGFACQLKVSTMERAAVNGAIPHQLLLNHRARGGLEKLGSKMFYGGAMRSSKDMSATAPEHLAMYPKSTIHLLNNFIRPLVGGYMGFRVPRVLVHNTNMTPPLECKKSFWNPAHTDWVMKKTKELLEDPLFLQPPEREGDQPMPGTIIITSPYKEAVIRYQIAIAEMLPNHQDRERVLALTIDTAQGQEADVVILDMVRLHATEHLENAKRLCVAITRAKQAEIVVMSEKMFRGKNASTGYLRDIYRGCAKREDGIIARVAM